MDAPGLHLGAPSVASWPASAHLAGDLGSGRPPADHTAEPRDFAESFSPLPARLRHALRHSARQAIGVLDTSLAAPDRRVARRPLLPGHEQGTGHGRALPLAGA